MKGGNHMTFTPEIAAALTALLGLATTWIAATRGSFHMSLTIEIGMKKNGMQVAQPIER